MRTILFFSTFCPNETSGGVEHVTYQLHKLFISKGYNCKVLYQKGNNNDLESDFIKVSEYSMQSFIDKYFIDNSVDRIIIQGAKDKIQIFITTISKLKLKPELIFVNHGDPFYLFSTFQLDTFLFYFKTAKGISKYKNFVKICLYPCLELYRKYAFRKEEICIQKAVDKMVFISENSKNAYKDYFNGKVFCDLCFANNPLSYKSEGHINSMIKHKNVLFVGRMEEFTKKISLALKIWKKISIDKTLSDWKLIMLGDGADRESLEKYSNDLGCSNVTFKGQCDPREYYKEASILLFTSVSEGWGMAITEAMQMSCVPIAFDSFPAAKQLISNGKNGELIEYPELETFTNRLKFLMKNDMYRNKLSECAVISAEIFNNENIYKQWQSIFNFE